MLACTCKGFASKFMLMKVLQRDRFYKHANKGAFEALDITSLEIFKMQYTSGPKTAHFSPLQALDSKLRYTRDARAANRSMLSALEQKPVVHYRS